MTKVTDSDYEVSVARSYARGGCCCDPMSEMGVRRAGGGAFQWVQAPPGIAPTGSNRRSHGGNEVAEAFRRFLIHVLPHGFHRIRHYGLFASGTRADTSPARVSCSPLQNLKASPPLPPSIPASRLVDAAAAA
jgi:hypothetical protein